MDLSFTEEDCAFRHEVRAWLHENIPTDERPLDFSAARAWDMAWQRRQFDGGYGGIAWPREYGGQGLPLVRQLIWFEEYAKAGGPGIGCGLRHYLQRRLRRANAHRALHAAAGVRLGRCAVLCGGLDRAFGHRRHGQFGDAGFDGESLAVE